jgi:hypothetical protein
MPTIVACAESCLAILILSDLQSGLALLQHLNGTHARACSSKWHKADHIYPQVAKKGGMIKASKALVCSYCEVLALSTSERRRNSSRGTSSAMGVRMGVDCNFFLIPSRQIALKSRSRVLRQPR